MNQSSAYKYFCGCLVIVASFTSCFLLEESDGLQELNVIVENSADGMDQFTEDRYGNVLGVVQWEDMVRVYYQNRGHNRAEYSESKDLRTWSDPEPVEMSINMFLFEDGDQIRCYLDEGEGNLVLYSIFNPVQGCQKRDGVAYNWKLDGQVSMNVINGEYVSTGRVRGNRGKSEGGWEGDVPLFPVAENFSEVAAVFEDYSYYKADDFLKDRRGISIHRSENGEEWQNSILADPAEMDLFGFKGWNSDEANGIADFYASTLVDKERILIKVFWKEKGRLIDRSEYSESFREDVRRRYRFTGETTIVPGIIKNGKLRLTSVESVIPLDQFKRVVSEEVHWATAHDREEVGQFSLANRVFEKENYVYLFFQYRDDIHYEFHESMRYSGIFVHKMEKGEFDDLFK